MNILITVVGILLIVASIGLIAMVLMQSAKNSRMSGVVSGGGAETFFGKYKGKTIDKKLNRLTVIISLAFVAIVIVLYMVQPGTGKVEYEDPNWDQAQAAMTATTTGKVTEKPTTTKPAADDDADKPAETTGAADPETTPDAED